MIITIQPSIMANGTLPYPFHVDAKTGLVERQDFWRGKISAVIGFTDTPTPGTALTLWPDIAADPKLAIGKYVTTNNVDGEWSLHTNSICSVAVDEPVLKCGKCSQMVTRLNAVGPYRVCDPCHDKF